MDSSPSTLMIAVMHDKWGAYQTRASSISLKIIWSVLLTGQDTAAVTMVWVCVIYFEQFDFFSAAVYLLSPSSPTQQLIAAAHVRTHV